MQSDNISPDRSADAFFASTLRYIQFQKQKGGAMGEKYAPIKVWFVNWLYFQKFLEFMYGRTQHH